MGNLSAAALAMLQEQYRHETCNEFRYMARSSWARFRGLEGIADFFKQEAKGEHKHSIIVKTWIEDRNEALIIEPLAYDEPSVWATFAELFETAIAVEYDTTQRLNAIYAQALEERDYQLVTQVSELVIEQIEEENLYRTILDRIAQRGNDAGAAHDVDVWVAKKFVK